MQQFEPMGHHDMPNPALPPVQRLPLAQADKGIMLKVGQPMQAQGAFAAQVVLTVLVSCALFMLFILAFFFLLTRNVEQAVVSSSVQRVVSQLTAQVLALVPQEQAAYLNTLVQGLQAPDTTKQDNEVLAANKQLTQKAGMVVGVTAFVVFVIALVTFLGMKAKRSATPSGTDNYPDPVHVLLTATFGFAAVAVCELAFLYMVAARYQPLDTTKTRNAILHALVTGIQGLLP
jgi:hypothetical protein